MTATIDLNCYANIIKEFLNDVHDHLKSELQSFDYQNRIIDAEKAETANRNLIRRCETILEYIQSVPSFYLDMKSNSKVLDNRKPNAAQTINSEQIYVEEQKDLLDTTYDPCYMSADPVPNPNTDQLDTTAEYSVLATPPSEPVALQHTETVEETPLQAASSDCPYGDLPATHLPTLKSEKFGTLIRSEKRLFFEQSKKTYCGLISEWLLCYEDGASSVKPSQCIRLLGATVNHCGEKRKREVCFQITLPQANPLTVAAETNSGAAINVSPTTHQQQFSPKQLTFQASNEIDAKEWIHAIEAAIRIEPVANKSPTLTTTSTTTTITSLQRKLPTPPMTPRISGISRTRIQIVGDRSAICEGIYEEPSSPPVRVAIKKSKAIVEKVKKIGLEDSALLLDRGGNTNAGSYYDIPKSSPYKNSETRNCYVRQESSINHREFAVNIKAIQSKLLAGGLTPNKTRTTPKKRTFT